MSMCAHACVHVCTYVHECICACVHRCVHVRTLVCACICACVCICVCVCVRECVQLVPGRSLGPTRQASGPPHGLTQNRNLVLPSWVEGFPVPGEGDELSCVVDSAVCVVVSVGRAWGSEHSRGVASRLTEELL